MREFKAGVVDPRTVPTKGLGEYFATTYAGYLGEVQNRLWELHQALEGPGFISATFQKEVWSIQLRICIELLCFAVVDFDQVKNGLIGARQRSKIDLDVILKKRKDALVWPISLPGNWETSLPSIADGSAPICRYASLTNPKAATKSKGQLDNMVHGQRRPRKADPGHLTFEQIYTIYLEVKAFGERQLIWDAEGKGWFVDVRKEYRQATGNSIVDFDLFFIERIPPSEK